MRWGRRIVVGVGAAALVGLGASNEVAAQADDPPNATGPCTADALLSNGTVIDPYTSSGPYEVPLAGSAEYSGTIGDGADRDERAFSGEVVIKTPPLFPDVVITDSWKWNGTGPGQSDEGTVTWDLPGWIPRDVEVTVEGFHQDDGARCEGSIVIELEGGLTDSPLAPAALGGTALALAGVGFSMVPRRGGAA